MTFLCKATRDGRGDESGYYKGVEEEDRFVSRE